MFHSKLNLATTGAPPGAVLCAAQLSSVRPKKSETTKLWPSPPPLGRTMSTLTRSTLSRSKTAGSAHGREGERLLRGADAARDVGQRAAGRGQRERARRGGGRLGGPALLAFGVFLLDQTVYVGFNARALGIELAGKLQVVDDLFIEHLAWN